MAISNEIQCTFCGLKGELGWPEAEGEPRAEKVFRHLGHNPFSGHLHYQCPSCAIVLLVDPMDILEGRSLLGVSSTQSKPKPLQAAFTEILEPFKAFRKILPNPWIPAGAAARGNETSGCQR